jgi:pimeloyl-ACP methyl ester carboxylesterase
VNRLQTVTQALIVDVHDALDLDRALVVATSFGGFMAFHAAAAYPDRIDRMVEFGWAVGAPTRTMPVIMRVASVRAIGRLMATPPPRLFNHSRREEVGFRPCEVGPKGWSRTAQTNHCHEFDERVAGGRDHRTRDTVAARPTGTRLQLPAARRASVWSAAQTSQRRDRLGTGCAESRDPTDAGSWRP